MRIELNTFIDFYEKDVIDGVLTIPEGVETIKGANSYSCVNAIVKKIVLPSTLKEIDKYAFTSKVFRNIEIVEFNNGLEKIDEYAFYYCNNLREVVLPNSVKEIGESAFKSCSTLKKVVLPQNLKVLNKSVFFGCEKLKEIILPSKLERIEKDCFYSSGLEGNIKLPSTIKFVDIEALHCKNNVNFIIDKKNLLKDRNVCIVEAKLKDRCQVEENDESYSISYYSTQNPNLTNSLAKDYFVLGDNKKIEKLFKNQTNINISSDVILSLNNDLKNNKEIDMQYYFNLLKQYSNLTSSFDIFAYNIGLFSKNIKETRISKSGNEITQIVNYAHKAYEILRNLDKSIFDMHAFSGFDRCEFKPAFAKFFLDKNNTQRLLELEKQTPGFIAMCYNKFEDIQAINTSNKGNQRQLAPTVEKFVNYFKDNKFSGVGKDEIELAQFIGKYYDKQKTFDLAKYLVNKQKKMQIKSNITNQPIVGKKIEKIETHKKSIFTNALEILKSLAHISNAEFTYEFLDKHNYVNMILGKLCNCCSHLEGAGEGLATMSMLHPDFQNLVIKNDKDEIIAKSSLYINREECYGVFNNVEVSGVIPYYDLKKVYLKYIEAVNDFVKVYNAENPNKKLKQINVGMGNNDLGVEIIKHNKKSIILDFPDISNYSLNNNGYKGDSRGSQYVIYKSKENENQNDKEK